MGDSWLWNFVQYPRGRLMNEADMRDIPYPATELGIHIAFKNYEAGSLIGGFIVAPLWTMIKKTGNLAQLKLSHRIGICGRWGIFAGLLLTPVMEYALIKGRKVDEAGLRDRCYRIRYNKKQLLIDRAVFLASIFGLCAFRWRGLVFGTNAAVLVGTVYNALLFDRLRDNRLLGDTMQVPDKDNKPPKV